MVTSDPILLERTFWVVCASFAACLLVLLTKRWHGRLSLDHDLEGVQKLHTRPVPRVGGIGLMAGLCLAGAVSYATNGNSYPATFGLLACALPVFFAGLIEDLTKQVSVRARLLSAFASAALSVWLLGAYLPDTDLPGVDLLLQQFPVLAILFTIFAVGGMTHAVNIIDGLNGLAAGSVSIMLAGLGALAWMHGDVIVMKVCMWGIGGLLGFMLLNYPFGRIFLGDGGAYLAGFWVAECAVLLLSRNPQISNWTVLLCVLYPVLETGYSMFRRRFIHKVPSGQPDMGHMHQLLHKWINNRLHHLSLPNWLGHGVTSVKIWAIVAACQLIALSTPHYAMLHVLCVAGVVVLYTIVHRALWHEDEADSAPP